MRPHSPPRRRWAGPPECRGGIPPRRRRRRGHPEPRRPAGTGRYQIKRFITADNGRTKALGTLTGKITQRNGEAQRVTRDRVKMVVADGTVSPPAPQGQVGTQQEACDILTLTLGPLDLNLLGLRVQLNQVQLDITAVPGAGNLLGNLLCAVAGLLDSPRLPDLGEVLTNLLNAILALLRA